MHFESRAGPPAKRLYSAEYELKDITAEFEETSSNHAQKQMRAC